MNEPHATRSGNEPTELLPVVPPRVAARAVIVYEPEPRRSRGLLVFTAVLVALTVGVVLGQAVAYQPASHSVSAAAQADPVPSDGTPVEALPGPPPVPVVTAPLGAATTQAIEVTGASAVLQVRGADLGDVLFSAATIDGVLPEVVTTSRGPRLKLAAGRTELLLNAAVTWTVRLTGGFADQEVDMHAGRLAGMEMRGGASRTLLSLPPPAKTVALRVGGAVGELRVRVDEGTAVRLRLGKGAGAVTFGGTNGRVRSGAVLATKGWRPAKHRYDITAAAHVDAVRLDQAR
jgi:hypothetical protein